MVRARNSLAFLLIWAAVGRADVALVEGVPGIAPELPAIRGESLALSFGARAWMPLAGVAAVDADAGAFAEIDAAAEAAWAPKAPVLTPMPFSRALGAEAQVLRALAAKDEPIGIAGPAPYGPLARASASAVTLREVMPLDPLIAAFRPEAMVYGKLWGTSAVELDPFLTPLRLWRCGPLGVIKAAAVEAAERGDRETFDYLKGRFWVLYESAAARRAAFERKSRDRK